MRHEGRLLALTAFIALLVAACARGVGSSRGASVVPATCRADLRLLAGACVPTSLAEAHCGVTAVPTSDGSEGIRGSEGCAPRARCGHGRARDLSSGECLARRDVRALGVSLGILVADNEVLGCPGKGELAFAAPDGQGGAPQLGCLAPLPPLSSTRCPPGSVAALGGCIRVIDDGSSGDRRIDVVRWLHAVIGPEGATGRPPLCLPLARSPVGLEGRLSNERLSIRLVFPNNDVTQLVLEVHALGASGAADQVATVQLERTLRPLVEALRSLGGTASEASVTTIVVCRGEDGGRPAALGSEGRSPSNAN